MSKKYYLHNLYPFQDEILNLFEQGSCEFYLSGGTALSRYCLQHRYSDDLDFFLNNQQNFKQQCELAIELLNNSSYNYSLSVSGDSFLRIFVKKNQITLKIDFINDVSFHYGNFEQCDCFSKVDNWRNILSNKVCALSRMEPKDYADILYIAQKFSFVWEDIIEEARKKDFWVEPIEVSKLINEFPVDFLSPIKWVAKPDFELAQKSFVQLSKDILSGNQNSLVLSKKYTKEICA